MYNVCTVRSDHTGRKHTYTDGIVGKVVQEASGTWGWAHFLSLQSVSSNHSRATLNQSQRRKRAAGHMSDQSTALLPFSMLTTYVPDGDQDTEFMAELQTGQKDKVYWKVLLHLEFDHKQVHSAWHTMHKQYFYMASKCPVLTRRQRLKRTISNQSLYFNSFTHKHWSMHSSAPNH